jgi:hypothetical protein
MSMCCGGAVVPPMRPAAVSSMSCLKAAIVCCFSGASHSAGESSPCFHA